MRHEQHYTVTSIMIRAVFKYSIAFLVVFALLNTTFRAVGSLAARNPVTAGFTMRCENVPLPCWYGIIPGVTTVAQTQENMIKMGYEPSRRSSYGIISYGEQSEMIPCAIQATYYDSTGPIAILRFQGCNGLLWGDLALQLGLPNRLIPTEAFNQLIYDGEYHAGINVTQDFRRLSPYYPISQIEIFAPEERMYPGWVMWKGFQAQVWYCREFDVSYGIHTCNP